MKIEKVVPFRLFWCLFLILSCPGIVQPVTGAGLRDLQDGWLLTPAEVVLVMDSSGFPPSRPYRWQPQGGGWISVGQTRLFGMLDLPVTGLSGGWRRNFWGMNLQAEFSWEQTGQEIFLEDRKEYFLGFGDRTMLGLDCCLSGIWIEDESEASHTEVTCVVVHRRVIGDGTLVRLGWRFDLTEPSPWFGRQGRRALASLSILLPSAGLGLGVVLDRNGEGSPGLSLDISLGLSDRFGLGLRADPPTGSLGPSTLWKSGMLLVRTSHVAHPDLGLTHRVSLTFGDLKAVGL